MTKIFEDLGIFGVRTADETAILSAIFSGDPVLLIGPPGCNKTESIYLIGNALRESTKRKYKDDQSKWFNHHVYDSSKLTFEDLIGWPNPKALQDGNVDWIKSPTTVWEKDMIAFDELNRCGEDRQANVLELLRHRTCMGSKTNVKFVFSAINPFGDAGTITMSDALIDRHVFYVHFNNFRSLTDEDKIKVTKKIGSFDSIGLKYWTGKNHTYDTKDFDNKGNIVINDYMADQGDRIFKIIDEAVKLHDVVSKQYFEQIAHLINNLDNRFASDPNKKDNPDISGRRAGMIARNFIAFRCIDLARANLLNIRPIPLVNAVTNVVTLSLPIGVTSPAKSDTVTRIEKITRDAVSYWENSVLSKNDKDTEFIYDLYYNKDPLFRLQKLLEYPDIDSLAHNKIWAEIVQGEPEISNLFAYLHQKGIGSLPEHLNNEDLEQKIRVYNATLAEEIESSPILTKWKDELSKLDEMYKDNEILMACLQMSKVMINRVVTDDLNFAVSLNNIKSLMATCKDLLMNKKDSAEADKKKKNARKPKKIAESESPESV